MGIFKFLRKLVLYLGVIYNMDTKIKKITPLVLSDYFREIVQDKQQTLKTQLESFSNKVLVSL